jgi:N-acetylglucosaminyldiphosphoundecaprenol N-acetyl-beta-D-mannosaminyltransferase
VWSAVSPEAAGCSVECGLSRGRGLQVSALASVVSDSGVSRVVPPASGPHAGAFSDRDSAVSSTSSPHAGAFSDRDPVIWPGSVPVVRLRSWPVRPLFGVPIDALTMERALALVAETIERRGRLLIGVVNAAKLVNMRRDEVLSRAVRCSDIILADGMAVVWACRLLHRPVPQRLAGIDLMTRMLEQAARRSWRVYCLGATDEVLAAAVERMRADYPGLLIAGQRNGYFTAEQEPHVVAEIRAARPDVLFVGISPPQKELFLVRRMSQLDVPVCHGVGGSFDVLAGKVRRAPESWQRLGMEWLYRAVQEPRRLWARYLVTNLLFCGMVLRELGPQVRHSGSEY